MSRLVLSQLLFLAVLAHLCFFSRLRFVLASSVEGLLLAELLENESVQSPGARPSYALFHAFKEETKRMIVATTLLDSVTADSNQSRLSQEPRQDGLLNYPRTVVDKGANASVDMCLRFHTRHFFQPESGAASVSPSTLQLWPYFYQYKSFLAAMPAQTLTQVHCGVLDIDATALSALVDLRTLHDIELVLLAYNDWDAYADEALAALHNFTHLHSGALYSVDGLARLTSKRVRLCGQNSEPLPEAVVAVRRNGLDWIATSTGSQGSVSASAKYAALRLRRTATEGKGTLQLVGAARMAAFGARHSAANASAANAYAFAERHRSASPQLYFLTSQNMATMGLSAAAIKSPPSVIAQHGFAANDVHRFVHQHTRSSFLLTNRQAYYVALQLHQRILVLVGDPTVLPQSWWASLSGPPQASTAMLRALRQRIPFFLSVSAGPISSVTPAAGTARSAHRCVLPPRRLEVGNETRVLYGDAGNVSQQMQTLVWSSDALQLRLVQQRAESSEVDVGGEGAGCQWVQSIELPYPTAETDPLFYDTAVMGALMEFVQRVQQGEGDWVVRLRTTEDFARQLDHLLQPAVQHVSRTPPPALFLAVEASADCTAALQHLRQRERGVAERTANDGSPAVAAAAAATYATLSARLTTVQEELSLAAQTLPLDTLSTVLSGFPSTSSPSFSAWNALIARCPFYVVVRSTEDIYRVTTATTTSTAAAAAATDAAPSPDAATAASLEVVEDEALAVSLLELHHMLPQQNMTTANTAMTAERQGGDDGAAAAAEDAAPELHSPSYTSVLTKHQWRIVLPAKMEVPMLVYDMTADAQAVLATALPASEPTYILLIQRECGVCSNYWKAFELLRRTYRRSGGHDVDADGEGSRFVQVDLSVGFAASRVEGLKRFPSERSRAHWGRAQAVLLPYYVTHVRTLKVPQLLLINGTHVSTTLPTEVYAERWHWPHALLRLMALTDAAVDVEATKLAMWELLEGERRRHEPLRSGSR